LKHIPQSFTVKYMHREKTALAEIQNAIDAYAMVEKPLQSITPRNISVEIGSNVRPPGVAALLAELGRSSPK
jgi:hypothetical protein